MTAAKRRAASLTVTCGTSNVQQQQQYQHHFQQQPQQQQQQQQQQVQEHQLHSQSRENHQILLQQQQQQQHNHHQQQQQHQHHLENQTASHQTFRDCSIKLPLDILWLPKSAMRPVLPDATHTDCILVVGVSRPKLAVVFLTVMLISLFLTFHVLYDSAVYNLQAAQVVTERHRRLALLSSTNIGLNHIPNAFKPPTAADAAAAAALNVVAGSNQINHPMVFPSNRVHFPKTSRRLPQALIIGIRKCGTRALLEMLYLHPRIQKAGGEVHFFDRDENYLKGLEWYRKKMPHSFRGQITIEKSPSYFVSPEVPERVRAMNASIKLLLIVREPVTRAISDYTQLRSHAATASLPLADAVLPLTQGRSLLSSGGAAATAAAAATMQKIPIKPHIYNKLNVYSSAQVYDNSLDGGGAAGNMAYTTTPANVVSSATIVTKSFEELAIFPNGTVNESYRPLTISMYHLHLHRWLEVFPREQLLIVNGDRLIEDPVSELRRIENFLGIEHRVTSSHFYFNETKGFYCLRYDSGDRCLRETKGRRHPYVNPVVVSKLRKFFAEHNQRFYELVGEDLGWPEE